MMMTTRAEKSFITSRHRTSCCRNWTSKTSIPSTTRPTTTCPNPASGSDLGGGRSRWPPSTPRGWGRSRQSSLQSGRGIPRKMVSLKLKINSSLSISVIEEKTPIIQIFAWSNTESWLICLDKVRLVEWIMLWRLISRILRPKGLKIIEIVSKLGTVLTNPKSYVVKKSP